ncbi:MAG: hypothetical protein HY263_11245 [Chloroflexi bacterium]|nr:hypothetical protein [Chloroflexota bacterium]
MLTRTALAGALAALVLATPLAVAPARAASAPAPAEASPSEAVVAASPKVVIVVGATEGTTPSYRTAADAIAAEAIKWTPNVVKVYSPYATWSVVAAAAQGASVLVYIGHGNGFPSPYSSVLKPDTQDGMGLNTTMGLSDSDKKYYGESYIASGIRLAPNAVVFLQNLCYAPGAGEPGAPEPSISVAQQRVDNFSSGFIRAGARSVFAGDGSYVAGAIHGLFTTHAPILSLFRQGWSYNGNEIPFTPARNPAFQGILDPETWTTGFKHSVVADPTLTTDDVLAGAGKGLTSALAPSLTAPGAASVTATSLPVDTDQSLATPTGSALPAGTKVRVDDLVTTDPLPDGSTPAPTVQVHTLDGSVSGWVSADGLKPGDGTSPALWAMTGGTTVSPNYDGSKDQLVLWARLSEAVPWTWTLRDSGGNAVRTLTGTTDLFALTWDGLPGGTPAPPGTYHWTLHAEDAWGNAPLDATGDVTVVAEPIPTTAVLVFKSLNGTYTRSTSIAYQLTFATGVTGLAVADFVRSGTSTGCVVGAPTGGPSTWYLTVSGCTAGSVGLTLMADSVLDASLVAGPPIPASVSVRIDQSRPTTSAPTTSFRGSATVVGSTMPLNVRWTASDPGGSGIASYDVARSLDGAAFTTFATGLKTASLATTGASGHSYRFEVRARDRAGNVGSWVAGPTLRPALVQQTTTGIAWSGSWTTVTSTVASGGSVKTATAAGASVSYTFTGRGIGVVAQRDPTFGQVRVYIDGAYIVTADTYAAAHAERVVIYARVTTWATHTIKLVVVGTAGRPKVAIDAFTVMR